MSRQDKTARPPQFTTHHPLQWQDQHVLQDAGMPWVSTALLPALLPTSICRRHPCVTIQHKISKELKPENVKWSFYLRRSQLTVTMKQRKRNWVISNKLYQLPNLSSTADFLILLAVLCGSSKMTLLFDWIYL